MSRPKTNAHRALALHKKLGGKLRIEAASPIRTAEDLALVYTPGVGAVSSYIAEHPEKAREYTGTGRTVAVVSDGSAVLGLGNIGPMAALPVMEGKAVLFKEFGGLEAVPIVLNVHTADEIVAAVAAIAPGFGGINLEDIAAPLCFEVEDRLKELLSIPVMHDDQHGTAIVVLAALINAAKVVRKPFRKLRIAVIGAGAAGTAVAKLLMYSGVGDVVVTDSQGIIGTHRKGLPPMKRFLAKNTNKSKRRGGTVEAVSGMDVVVGVSGPGTLLPEHISYMSKNPIVFALANPVPEIMPDEATAAGAAVVATGRSDFPNQINNVLAFPGIFRGALDHRVEAINEDMKVRAAHSLAGLVKKPTAQMIIPSAFDKRVATAVAKTVR